MIELTDGLFDTSPGFRNRLENIRTSIARSGLDGILILSPENIHYFIGFSSVLLSLWREAGWAMLFIGKNDQLFLIVSDFEVSSVDLIENIETHTFPLWAHLEPPPKLTLEPNNYDNFRPETLDSKRVIGLLCKVFEDLHLTGSRIGTELDFASHNFVTELQREFPEIVLSDASSMIEDLRKIKDDYELQVLKYAAQITVGAVGATIKKLETDTGVSSIRNSYFMALHGLALESGIDVDPWAFIRIDGTGQPASDRVVDGCTIVLDVGVRLFGYNSDFARTFCWANSNLEQRTLYNALREAHLRGLDTARPGTPLKKIYQTILETIHSGGIKNYCRGHFGHTLGLAHSIEEAPYISNESEDVLQPGMVLAVETPYYSQDVGSFQIENMIQVTEDGCDTLTEFPDDLTILGP